MNTREAYRTWKETMDANSLVNMSPNDIEEITSTIYEKTDTQRKSKKLNGHHRKPKTAKEYVRNPMQFKGNRGNPKEII